LEQSLLQLPAGRTLCSGDLVGATLNIAVAGTPGAITIQSVDEDRHALGGRVLLHHFVVKDQASREVDLCTPDADGRSLGFPVPNRRPQHMSRNRNRPDPHRDHWRFSEISLVKRKTGISLRRQATLPRAAKPFRDTLSVGLDVIASGE
jgi:hypothetical protein